MKRLEGREFAKELIIKGRLSKKYPAAAFISDLESPWVLSAELSPKCVVISIHGEEHTEEQYDSFIVHMKKYFVPIRQTYINKYGGKSVIYFYWKNEIR